MKRTTSVLLSTVFFASFVIAQDPAGDDAAGQGPLANPTRPSASDNAFLTAPGYLEIETGWSVADNYFSFPALLKASIVKDMEFGFLMSGVIEHRSKPVSSTDVGDPGLQAKYQMMNEGSTAVAVVGKVEFTGPGTIVTGYITPTLTPFFGQIDATVGLSLLDGDASFLYAAAFAPKTFLPLGVYGELFGRSGNGYSPFYFDAGVSYSLSRDFVVDAAFAVGLNDDAADWQFQVGLTKVLVKIL